MKKVTILFCILYFCGTAFAQAEQFYYSENYLNDRKANIYLGAGVFIPSGSIEDGGYAYDLETGGNAEVGFQYFFNKNLGLGITLSGMSSESETKRDLLYYGDSARFNVSTTGIGLSGLLRHPMEKADLFVGFGLEYFMNTIEFKYSSDSISAKVKEDGSTLGIRLEGGGRYYLTDHINLGCSLAFIINNQEITFDSGYTETYNLGGVIFRVNLGYAF